MLSEFPQAKIYTYNMILTLEIIIVQTLNIQRYIRAPNRGAEERDGGRGEGLKEKIREKIGALLLIFLYRSIIIIYISV